MDTDARKENKAAKILLYPLILLNKGLNALLRKAVGEGYGESVTEDDILSMIDAGNEDGTIEDESAEMINNIFEFDDLTASDVMTHRVNIVAVDINESLDDLIYLALDEGFSRLPVFEGDIDKIVGIIIVKDLLCLVGEKDLENFSLRDFIREGVFIPESCPCNDTFKLLTSQKTGMAIVVDEYGGTYGIVTLNDLIEQIVGDRHESEDEGNVRKSGNGYLISGLADGESLDELFDLETDSDSATLGGWVMEKLEKIPEPGDTLEEAGILLKVTKANDKRVLEVYAEKLPDPEEDDGEEK